MGNCCSWTGLEGTFGVEFCCSPVRLLGVDWSCGQTDGGVLWGGLALDMWVLIIILVLLLPLRKGSARGGWEGAVWMERRKSWSTGMGSQAGDHAAGIRGMMPSSVHHELTGPRASLSAEPPELCHGPAASPWQEHFPHCSHILVLPAVSTEPPGSGCALCIMQEARAVRGGCR